MLEIRELKVSILGVEVLRGVGMTAPRREITALVGRNGAGKTTTIRSVMGLAKIASGNIVLDGEDITGKPVHTRVQQGIGYMPEDRRVIPSSTVEENLLMPTWNTDHGDADTRLSKIYEIIPEIKRLSRRKGLHLSGGEQKLVALGRAMMAGRNLLLLDEPFEGVAPRLVRRIWEVINSFQEELPIVISSSDYAEIEQFAHRAYFIDRGTIVESREGRKEA
ncbi:MAG: ATP-binding cassette domain-containing protein [Desulfosalsimonadaceae bacterium]